MVTNLCKKDVYSECPTAANKALRRDVAHKLQWPIQCWWSLLSSAAALADTGKLITWPDWSGLKICKYIHLSYTSYLAQMLGGGRGQFEGMLGLSWNYTLICRYSRNKKRVCSLLVPDECLNICGFICALRTVQI